MSWFNKLLKYFQTETEPIHKHDWDNWKPYGFSYQQRKCRTCGWMQRDEIK